MKLSDREDMLEQKQIRNHMYHRYLARFAGATAVAAILFLTNMSSCGKESKIPAPSQHNIEIAETLLTVEGRETAIDEKYDGAKIIAEKTYGNDIISVFEVGYMHSFCVFESIEDGYWMEYCGDLFPKTDLVKGTVYLGDNTHEYDVYLKGDTPYTRLLVTRTYKRYSKYKEKQNIHFDENGIGITKNDFQSTRFYNPSIIAYDAEGNEYLLDDGGIF
ncbi:hypothetical protein [Anaerotignum sp.]